MKHTLRFLSALLLSPVAALNATEYFVSKDGLDTNPGTGRAAALATIQKGVDALQPGDTLTIGPGEYHEAVKRIDMGSVDKDTIIRAEIPGTVVLRGDVPAPAFRPVAGHRFVHVADFDFKGEVPVVNEIDTLTILKRMPNSAELEFIPGTFFHDVKAGKLFISTSDMKPAQAHHYSVSTLPTHGVYLVRPRRVVIEGIAVTGFSAMELLHYREETGGGVWGIYLVHGKSCVIRDCHAWLNAWGIGMQSGPPGSGDNVVERCVSWANTSVFANGDMGGITVFAGRRDVIRDSTAFLNGMYGINIYGTGGAAPNYKDDGGNEPKNRSLLQGNLAWGNGTADIKIKTGYEYHHAAENCVGAGLWSVTHVTNGLMGRGAAKTGASLVNNIDLSSDAGVVPQQEFADPDHHDYRLQATSRYRGKGPEGKDLGPFPYAANIFYVKPDGDDKADGLSVTAAWKTLARAVSKLRAGDTLYIEPGVYAANLEIHAEGKEGAAIAIRGRGKGRVVIRGTVSVGHSSGIKFARLYFDGGVKVSKASAVVFDNCEFAATGTPLDAAGIAGLTVSHCVFTSDRQASVALNGCSQVDLRGNLFGNAQGAALRVSDIGAVRYSDYNSYRNAATAWEVGGKNRALAEVQKDHDQHSRELKPEFAVSDAIATLKNAALFAAGGPLGKSIGRHEDEARRSELTLIGKPIVHSVSATTANLEWTTSLPATCVLAWGETPACENSATFNVNSFGSYSLTGLKPGQLHYFAIRSLDRPKDLLPKIETTPIPLADAPITFTTLKQNPAPATYHVATDGDDSRTGLDRMSAWKTIRHAAEKVNAGDTVLIAGGKYSERIRVRATGENGSPITFRAMPGERVDIDGSNMALNTAFAVTGKSHLRFDGFYLAGFNLFPNDGWGLQNSGEFHLYRGKDIAITRCFSEGRGGYSAAPVAAWEVDSLLIKNCVNTYKFGGMYFWRCPNLVIQNTVFAEPMIMAFVHRNEKKQKAVMENCIFTDMLEKKARLNIGVLCCDGENESYFHRNNCYFLRDCIPLEQRALDGRMTLSQLGEHILEPLFADPLFAGDPGAKGNPGDKSGFSPDRMMDATFKVDFDSFFTTNPELIKRGIGLQPEAFAEMLRK
jgi:hypothetical protein